MSQLSLESDEKWLGGKREQGMSRELWGTEQGLGWLGREEGPLSRPGDLGVCPESTRDHGHLQTVLKEEEWAEGRWG